MIVLSFKETVLVGTSILDNLVWWWVVHLCNPRSIFSVCSAAPKLLKHCCYPPCSLVILVDITPSEHLGALCFPIPTSNSSHDPVLLQVSRTVSQSFSFFLPADLCFWRWGIDCSSSVIQSDFRSSSETKSAACSILSCYLVWVLLFVMQFFVNNAITLLPSG